MSRQIPDFKRWNGVGQGSVSVDDTAGGTIIVPELNGGQGYSYMLARNVGSETAYVVVGDTLTPTYGQGIEVRAGEWFQGDDRGMPTGTIRAICDTGLSTTFSYFLGD